MTIHNAKKRMPKGRYVYLLYSVEGHDETIVRGPVKFNQSRPPIMGDMCMRGEEHFIPLGYVYAEEMMAMLWSHSDASIDSLKEIGKFQAIWYKPKEEQ